MKTKLHWLGALCALAASGTAVRADTKLVKTEAGFQMLVDGKPFRIKGVGGDGNRQLIVDLGGNSYRTWGAEDLDAKLAEAQKLGLKVTVGVWLGHERHGFNYNNAEQVADQYSRCVAVFEKYKSHPAVLMWAIGNEMEGYKAGDNAAIWSAVNNIASAAKRIDPSRPTMTVISEVGGQRVSSIHRLCPDIDIVGINTYAGVESIGKRYRAAGGTKPFVVTEFGPPGTWEVEKNSYGAIPEPTSTQKGELYKSAYKTIESDPLALGSYAFTWGSKQEATATWFGMMLPDGSRLEAVDAIGECWSGSAPKNRVPRIEPVALQGPDMVDPGSTVRASVKVTDAENDPVEIKWELHREAESYGVGGDAEAVTPNFPEAIISHNAGEVEVKMPADGGVYRLYALARDGKGGAAMSNVTIFCKGKVPPPSGKKSNLPVALYGDEVKAMPFVPSGWMGNNGAIGMDDKCTISPRSGQYCMKLEYRAPDNFAGIVWQNPPNDWGDLPGGLDLTGATKLTFWARGENGGEKVEFKFGVLGREKKFFDTASGGTTVTLTKEWTEYSIDVTGKDLSQIKTGFVWVLGGQGKPVTFYLDDVRYQ